MADDENSSENGGKPAADKMPPHLQTEDQKGAGPIGEPGSGRSETDDPRGPGNLGHA